MGTAHRRRLGSVKSTEVAFVSTFAIVILFALYSFGRSYAENTAVPERSLLLRAQEEQDLEVSHFGKERVTEMC